MDEHCNIEEHPHFIIFRMSAGAGATLLGMPTGTIPTCSGSLTIHDKGDLSQGGLVLGSPSISLPVDVLLQHAAQTLLELGEVF